MPRVDLTVRVSVLERFRWLTIARSLILKELIIMVRVIEWNNI